MESHGLMHSVYALLSIKSLKLAMLPTKVKLSAIPSGKDSRHALHEESIAVGRGCGAPHP